MFKSTSLQQCTSILSLVHKLAPFSALLLPGSPALLCPQACVKGFVIGNKSLEKILQSPWELLLLHSGFGWCRFRAGHEFSSLSAVRILTPAAQGAQGAEGFPLSHCPKERLVSCHKGKLQGTAQMTFSSSCSHI